MTTLRGRLAPSPTGGLHVGNVRTLMLAWLSARAAGGHVVLRVEDLDRARCRPGLAEQMVQDLRWLGLDWDEGPDVDGPHAPYEQSLRSGWYEEALGQLIDGGYAFPCVCSRADLAGAASAPHGPDGPVYPGTCRDRFRGVAEAASATGRRPAWRFNSRRSPSVTWKDQFRPGVGMPNLVDDFVLWRADGVPAYQLAVVVDDLAMGVTEVVRGDDLVHSTPRQLALIRALGGTAPTYLHVPLVMDDDGRRLAKRSGATQIAELRRLGVAPERLIGLLAYSCGLVPADAEATTTSLLGVFAWERIPHEPVQILEHNLQALVR